MLASEMGAKPYLILEIDAHTAMPACKPAWKPSSISSEITGKARSAVREFKPARLIAGGQVSRGNGEQVALTDPRVKVYFPNFSQFHAESLAMSVRWQGLHPGK